MAPSRPITLPEATLPPERLYWSILQPPRGLRLRAGLLPIGLRAAFEEDVPLSALDGALTEPGTAHDLHIVCTPLADGRILACGALATELKLLPRVGATLTPSALPEFIQHELSRDPHIHHSPGGEPAHESAHYPDPEPGLAAAASLNLLVGDLEPAHIRRARLRRRLLFLATGLLAGMLIIVGSERRIRHDRELAAGAYAAADRAARELGEVFGSSVRITPDTLPAVLASAQRSVDAASRVSIPRDAGEPLASLLKSWPSSASPDTASADAAEASAIGWACTIQTLGVTADSIALTLTIEGDAAAFLRGLSAPPGWSLSEPRLTSISRPAIGKRSATRDAATSSSDPDAAENPPDLPLTRVTLTLRPAAESSATASRGAPP